MKKLWYTKEARIWEEALPAGNGRLGAMFFHAPFLDRIQINEETLWSGHPDNDTRIHSKEKLEEIRKLVAERKYPEAEKAAAESMINKQTGVYTPYGSIFIELDGSETNGTDAEVTDYKRELDMETGILKCEYRVNGNKITKEAFISNPDDVMVIHITCEKRQHFNIYQSVDTMHKNDSYKDGSLCVEGKCPVKPLIYEPVPDCSEDEESIVYSSILAIAANDESVNCSNVAAINLKNVTDITILFAIKTSFNGYDKMPQSEGREYKNAVRRVIENAAKKSYDELKKRHIDDYKSLFDRVYFDLGEDNGKPTNERITNCDGDNQLIELLFDFGRYLTITASREGTQPSTLQGIWNKDIIAAWRSAYTVNINTQMNYWPTESINLPECHMPLLNMLEDFCKKGNTFGFNGWSLWHNTDIWRLNYEVGETPVWSYWQMGGFWFCRHIWEHYIHTLDKEFLKNNMHILTGAIDFLKDWMIVDKDGYLTTCPSTSPENKFIFDGKRCSVCSGSAMDLSIIRDLLKNTIKACKVLGKDSSDYKEMLARIRPLKIGSDGRLLEWNEEFEENEICHRHVSHLYCIYPSNLVTEKDTDYYNACKKSLEVRLENGGGQTGWSNAWTVNFLARFGESEKAYGRILTMFKRSIYMNMFDAHPPFQIDGNYGITAGIIEMLIQSHIEYGDGYVISFLPACPKEFDKGILNGIKVRGGHTVNMKWDCDECVADIKVMSDELYISADNNVTELTDKNGKAVSCIIDDNVRKYCMNYGEDYIIKIKVF